MDLLLSYNHQFRRLACLSPVAASHSFAAVLTTSFVRGGSADRQAINTSLRAEGHVHTA